MDKDTWLEWANTFAELRKQGVVPPGDINVTDKELDPALDLLVNGNVLFRNYHAAQAGALDSMNPGVYGMVTMPRGPGGRRLAEAVHVLERLADSPYIEEAKKFIDWFINDKEAGEILGTTRAFRSPSPCWSICPRISRKPTRWASSSSKAPPRSRSRSSPTRKDGKSSARKIIRRLPRKSYSAK